MGTWALDIANGFAVGCPRTAVMRRAVSTPPDWAEESLVSGGP